MPEMYLVINIFNTALSSEFLNSHNKKYTTVLSCKTNGNKGRKFDHPLEFHCARYITHSLICFAKQNYLGNKHFNSIQSKRFLWWFADIKNNSVDVDGLVLELLVSYNPWKYVRYTSRVYLDRCGFYFSSGLIIDYHTFNTLNDGLATESFSVIVLSMYKS